MSVVVNSKRRSRALSPEVKAIRAIKRTVDGLEPNERQRVMEWAMAYAEGVGLAATARNQMALEAILTVSQLDAHGIARRALRR